MHDMNFDAVKEEFLTVVESALDTVLPSPTDEPCALHRAMREAVGSGGKRIRPLVCFGMARACGGEPADARYAAAALELLHNYTLVHDDLPAMDNDEMRRGKPTIWKAFGEANAILVGDALQALAFEVVDQRCADLRGANVSLARAAVDVVKGQVLDLAGGAQKEKNQNSCESLVETYRLKTAALFKTAAQMGAATAKVTDEQIAEAAEIGHLIGMAFQYQDDLLDGDSCLSQDDLAARVNDITRDLLERLAKFPGDASFLMQLIEKLVGRTN